MAASDSDSACRSSKQGLLLTMGWVRFQLVIGFFTLLFAFFSFLEDRDERQKGDVDAAFRRPYGVGSGQGVWRYIGWRTLASVGAGFWSGALLVYLAIMMFTRDIRWFW